MRRLLPALALFALSAGCDSAPSPAKPAANTAQGTKSAPASAPTPATAVEPAAAALLDQLGDGAPMVGLLDARSWPSVFARLKPVLTRAGFGSMMGGLERPEAAIDRLLSALAGNAVTLKGLDLQRPIALALFEAAIHGPPGSAAAAIDFSRPTPMRHEVILPATDPAALEASLRATLDQGNTKTPYGYDMGELQLGIKRTKDAVRIVGLLPARADNIEQMWRAPLAASARTPAFVELASPGAVAGLLVRPWRMRTAWGQHGANEMAFALMNASADMRMALFAKGLSIILSGARLMHAERPEFDDAVVRLTADDTGIAFEGTHALTALLAKAMDAGVPGRIFATRGTPMIDSWQRVDWRALIDNVGPRPVFAQTRRLRDVARGWQQCGSGCLLHTMLRAPFGTARGLLDMAPREVKLALMHLPTSTQVALLSMKGPQPTIALAADVPKAFDTGLIRQALPKDGVKIHLVPKGERAVLLMGVGVDPRTVYDLDAPVTVKGLGRTTVNIAAFGKVLAAQGVPAAPIVEGFGPATLEADRPKGARALRWRLHLSTQPGKAGAPLASRQYPASPDAIRSYAPSGGDACLAKAVKDTAALFDALATVAPDQRAALFGKGLDELAGQFSCAEAEASTAPAAKGLRRLYVQLAGASAPLGQPQQALPMIEAQCAASKDPWICGEVKRIKALPRYALPEVKLHCSRAWDGGRVIRVTSAGVALDDTPVDLDRIAALAEPVTLVADKDLPFSAVRPVLMALPKDTVHLQVNVEGQPRTVLIGAPFAAQPRSPADAAKTAIITADPNTPHGEVVRRIDAARKAGKTKIQLKVDAPAAPASGAGDTVVITAGPDTNYAEIIKQMDAARAAGKPNVVLKMDDGPAPPPDRFKQYLADAAPVQAGGGPPRFRVTLGKGQVEVRNLPLGTVKALGPIGQGDALKAAVDDGRVDLVVDPTTPWAEAAQALTTVCERGQLITADTRIPPPPRIVPGVKPLDGPGLSDALKSPAVDLPLAVGKGRDKQAIHAVIRRHTPQIRYCYERALMKNPKLAGKLKTRFTIAPDGAISAVKAEASDSMAAVSACIEGRMKRWRFPTAETSTTVNYPFVFKAE